MNEKNKLKFINTVLEKQNQTLSNILLFTQYISLNLISSGQARKMVHSRGPGLIFSRVWGTNALQKTGPMISRDKKCPALGVGTDTLQISD